MVDPSVMFSGEHVMQYCTWRCNGTVWSHGMLCNHCGMYLLTLRVCVVGRAWRSNGTLCCHDMRASQISGPPSAGGTKSWFEHLHRRTPHRSQSQTHGSLVRSWHASALDVFYCKPTELLVPARGGTVCVLNVQRTRVWPNDSGTACVL